MLILIYIMVKKLIFEIRQNYMPIIYYKQYNFNYSLTNIIIRFCGLSKLSMEIPRIQLYSEYS
ncbi:protein of unknown function [Tepidibacter aestuarii]|nr:protein of unknown function [Tepidibacter aestuarii]